MKKLLTLSLSLYSLFLFSQGSSTVYTAIGRGGVAMTFVKDYQALGVNPANIAWSSEFEGKHKTTGLFEGSASFYSQALKRPELKNVMTHFNTKNGFTLEDKKIAAQAFSEAGFSINTNLTSVGVAYQNNKIGGFAFSIKDKVNWYSKFNQTAAEILFLGYNAPYFDQKFDVNGVKIPVDSIGVAGLVKNGVSSNPKVLSKLLEGSQIKMNWLREYNLGFGLKIIKTDKIKLYAGMSVKYIQGMAMINVEVKNGKFNGVTSFSPGFKINFGSAALSNPSSIIDNTKSIFSPVGKGFGVDFGVSAIINDKLKLGISIIDAGFVRWSGNVYTAVNDTLVSTKTEGFNSNNIFVNTDPLLGGNGVLDWQGVNSVNQSLPLNMRFGASLMLIKNKLEIGFDGVIPLNNISGNVVSGVAGFGLDFTPVKFFTISTGFNKSGNYGTNIPLGITFNVGKGTWQFGVSTRDVVVFMSKNNPTLSIAGGFLRFRF